MARFAALSAWRKPKKSQVATIFRLGNGVKIFFRELQFDDPSL